MTDPKELGARLKEQADAEEARVEAETPEPETPEPAEPDEDNDDDDVEAEPEPEPEQAGRKGKTPQEKFQAGFARFVKLAAECFELTPAEVQVASYPGVVGIMLPGFTEPRTHENYQRCQTCNGLGKVLTGAGTGDATHDWHACPDSRCAGRGYWEKNSAQPATPLSGPLAVVPTPQPQGEWAEAPAWMGDPSLSAQAHPGA